MEDVMGIDWLVGHVWFATLLWAAMYIFDYYSTIWLARTYETTLKQVHVHEHGVELNPLFEKDIARQRRLSWRFLLALGLVFPALLLLGMWGQPLGYEIVLGGCLLGWLFVDSRHLRNYFYVLAIRRRSGAVSGQVRTSYWLSQRVSAFDALLWGLTYLLFAFLSSRLFFLGGALTCLVLAVRQWGLADRKLPTTDEHG